VDYELAYSRALELCRSEGLLAGPSSGLILEGALRTMERDGSGLAVLIFPDNVFKYVSNMVKHLPDLIQGIEA
jgi:cysteine synthase